jgi:hypothetical protein
MVLVYISYQVQLTHKYTFETQANPKEKISKVALLLL